LEPSKDSQHMSWADDYEDNDDWLCSETPSSTTPSEGMRGSGGSPTGAPVNSTGAKSILRPGAAPFNPSRSLSGCNGVQQQQQWGGVQVHQPLASPVTPSPSHTLSSPFPSATSVSTQGPSPSFGGGVSSQKLAARAERAAKNRSQRLPAALIPSLPECAPFVATRGAAVPPPWGPPRDYHTMEPDTRYWSGVPPAPGPPPSCPVGLASGAPTCGMEDGAYPCSTPQVCAY